MKQKPARPRRQRSRAAAPAQPSGRPPMFLIEQHELQAILDMENEARRLRRDLKLRLWCGATVEQGALGVHCTAPNWVEWNARHLDEADLWINSAGKTAISLANAVCQGNRNKYCPLPKPE